MYKKLIDLFISSSEKFHFSKIFWNLFKKVKNARCWESIKGIPVKQSSGKTTWPFLIFISIVLEKRLFKRLNRRDKVIKIIIKYD